MSKRNGQEQGVTATVDIESFAASLASMTDEEQGLFFTTFANALYANCKNEYGFQMQAAYIRDHINDKAREFAKALAFKDESR